VAERLQASVDDVSPHLAAEPVRLEPDRLDPRGDEHVGDGVAVEKRDDVVQVVRAQDTQRRRAQHRASLAAVTWRARRC
jgi:hypothetical protein